VIRRKVLHPKFIILLIVIVLITGLYYSGVYQQIEFTNIQKKLELIRELEQSSPLLLTFSFLACYVFLTALSIPGALVLTLLAGAIFGVTKGTILVSFASCLGATIAFILSRYLFREALINKYRRRYDTLNANLKGQEKSYLFFIRMIPLSPFVVINVLMGLTKIKLWTYTWITFVGMVPGNLVFVYAGRKISEITSPLEILTWPIILLLSALGLIPILLKKISKGSKWKDMHA
jgi:uncharacterized membrane protein YdjX (TVP38/TMEM64 family)